MIRAFLDRYIFSEDLSLEARRINTIYIVGILGALGTLVTRIVMRSQPGLIALIAGILITILVLMVLCNYFNLFTPLKWLTCIVVFDLFFPLAFFQMGGVDGSIAVYFVLGVVVLIFLYRGMARVIMLLVQFAITGTCYALGWYFPELVVPTDPAQQPLDYYVSYIVIALCIGAIVSLLDSILARERQQLSDASRLRYVVNQSARVLLATDTKDLGTSINKVLGLIGSRLDINRSYIWFREEHEDKLLYEQQYGWSLSGDFETSSLKSISGQHIIESVPAWELSFAKDEAINGPLSSRPADEQGFLGDHEIKSILVLPIYIENELWGFLSFDDCVNANRVFTVDEVEILRSAGIMLASAIIRDQLEAKRDEALNEALQASQAKGNFLSNMSHEMRTPMNAIIGMTTIGKNASDLEQKDYALDKIEGASTHLLGVINDILDMSKIEANKLELSLVPFDFERLIRQVVNVVNFKIEERHQHFFVVIDQAIPQQLIGDDQRLSQVITNLLSNAVKFTPEEGTIRLNAHLEGEQDGWCTLQLEVIDNGIGISAEQQERLFSSFEQADSSTSRKFGGTGLGLALSKRIVELMDGTVWVKSHLGEGSTFAFTVRLKRGEQEQQSPLKSEVDWQGLRLLVVDGEPEARSLFARLCETRAMSCDVVASGEEALACIGGGAVYDLCFIDGQLGRKDGAGPGGLSGAEQEGMSTAELVREIRRREDDAVSAGGAGGAKGATGAKEYASKGTDASKGKSEPQPRSIIVVISEVERHESGEEEAPHEVDRYLAKPLFPSAIIELITSCFGTAQASVAPVEDDPRNLKFPGTTILLAEDIAINQEIVLALLEPTEVTVDLAENGKIALDMFIADPGRYDIIFMDVQMPELNGLDATKAIRALDMPEARQVPIIAMTANVFKEDIDNCLAAGMDDHIGKPIDFAGMLNKIRYYLNRKVKAPSGPKPQLSSTTPLGNFSAVTGAKLDESSGAGDELRFIRYGVSPTDEDRAWQQGLAWSKDLETGNEEIDGQHRQLFGLVSNLIANSQEQNSVENIEATIEFLVSYTMKHFESEEALQQKTGYPGFEHHHDLHEAFKKEVVALADRFHEQGWSAELGDEISRSIVRWLITHLKGEDIKVAEHIRAQARLKNP